MRFSRIVLFILGLVLFTVSGCAHINLYKEGATFEEQGDHYEAALKYLDSLDIKPEYKKAKEALLLSAAKGYEEQLARATGHEDRKNFPKALTEYKELKTYLKRLDGHGVPEFDTIDVPAKIEAMANASAEERYVEAEGAMAGQRWEEAIDAYRKAQKFKSNYKDSQAKVATAFYSWAEGDLGAKEFRVAAGHFGEAVEAGGTGFRDAAHRGAAIFLALGQHFTKGDRCRQAVRDLRAAERLVSDPRITEALKVAEECAVTPVAVLPFENPTGTNLAGMALADTIADKVTALVDEDASEFVRLVERGALDAILSEQGLSAQGISSGSTSKIRGVRFLVLGKLTQVRFDTPSPSATSKSTQATEPYDCTKTRSDGGTYQGTCFRTVQLTYREVSGQLAARIVGTVKVVDVKTGEQLANAPVEAVVEDAVHFVADFKVGGNSVPASRLTMWEHTDGYGVQDYDLDDLAEARQSLLSEDEVVAKLVEIIATKASAAVVEEVDGEREAVDPGTLDIVELATR